MSNNQFNEENWNTVKRVEREETEDGEYKFSCGCVSDEEGEQFSLYDYFSDVLDVDYICNYRKEYTAVRVAVDDYFEEYFNCL